MAERDANLAPGDDIPTSQQNTCGDQSNQRGYRRKKQQKVERKKQQITERKKQQKAAGSGNMVECGQQSDLDSLPVTIKLETSTSNQLSKNLRMDVVPHDLMQQQSIQQPQFLQWQYENALLQAKIQQQNQLRERFLCSSRDFGGGHNQQQTRNPLIQQAYPPSASIQSSDEDNCSRRLRQYNNYLRNRPKDNNIAYWREFVIHFYAPTAREKWCFTSYENIGQHVLCDLSFPPMDAWCCEFCGARSGKGFVASIEILPRLLQMRFGSGEREEGLHLEFQQGYRLKQGVMVLEYGKAVLESFYEQIHVVREGKLRVVFMHDLKILSWEFCAHHHEEYLPRQLVAPQVNQLIDAAHKYQGTLLNCAFGRVSEQRLQADGHLFAKSGDQLTRLVESPLISDLGLSAKHSRCLEMVGVVNVMKNLMDFCFERKIGPIESLQTYPRAGNKTRTWGRMLSEEQETAEQRGIQNVQTDSFTPMSMHLDPKHDYNRFLACSCGVSTCSGDARSMPEAYYQESQGENLFYTTGSTPKSEHSFVMGEFDQNMSVQSCNPGPFHN